MAGVIFTFNEPGDEGGSDWKEQAERKNPLVIINGDRCSIFINVIEVLI